MALMLHRVALLNRIWYEMWSKISQTKAYAEGTTKCPLILKTPDHHMNLNTSESRYIDKGKWNEINSIWVAVAISRAARLRQTRAVSFGQMRLHNWYPLADDLSHRPDYLICSGQRWYQVEPSRLIDKYSIDWTSNHCTGLKKCILIHAMESKRLLPLVWVKTVLHWSLIFPST